MLSRTSTEFVVDGVSKGLQTRHKSKGKKYPELAAGWSFHHTEGPLSAIKVKGVARKGKYGQVVVELSKELRCVVAALLRVSPSIRRALQSERVHRVATNFYPTKISSGDGTTKHGCDVHVYVKGTSTTPIEAFRVRTMEDYYLYPSTISWKKESRTYKCTLGIIPYSHVGESRTSQRTCKQNEDNILVVPCDTLDQLLKVFEERWTSASTGEEDEEKDDDELYA
eukprot:scpid89489/ scgid25696/ 